MRLPTVVLIAGLVVLAPFLVNGDPPGDPSIPGSWGFGDLPPSSSIDPKLKTRGEELLEELHEEAVRRGAEAERTHREGHELSRDQIDDLAQFYRSNDRMDEAIAAENWSDAASAYEAAIQTAPIDRRQNLYFILGIACAHLDQTERATRALDEAERLGKDADRVAQVRCALEPSKARARSCSISLDEDDAD